MKGCLRERDRACGMRKHTELSQDIYALISATPGSTSYFQYSLGDGDSKDGREKLDSQVARSYHG